MPLTVLTIVTTYYLSILCICVEAFAVLPLEPGQVVTSIRFSSCFIISIFF